MVFCTVLNTMLESAGLQFITLIFQQNLVQSLTKIQKSIQLSIYHKKIQLTINFKYALTQSQIEKVLWQWKCLEVVSHSNYYKHFIFKVNKMESTNRSGLQCLQHPREQITNFCVNVDCLKPLCPDCVQIHTKIHQKQQIESWKHCVSKAVTKSKVTLDELRVLYEGQRANRAGKTVDIVQSQNLKRLANLRQKYHKLVDQIFNAHENALRIQVRQLYKIDQPDTSQLKMAIQQMEKVLMKLAHSNSVILALKKALLLDSKALIDYFSHFRNNRPAIPNDSFFTQVAGSMNAVRAGLERSINFDLQQMQIKPAQNDYQSPYQQRQYSNQTSVSPNEDPLEPLKISIPDYFRQDCNNKLLHFFIPCSYEMKVARVQQARRGVWSSIVFQAKSELPCYFKSIITPSGDIYLTGGCEQQRRCRQIYKFNFQRKTLDKVANMINQRSSHSICYLDQKIYIIGGFSGPNGEVTRDCEVFDLQNLKCSKIAPLNTPSANSAAASFSGQFIFKFGGIFNKSQGNTLIQMYSIKTKTWMSMNIQLPISKNNLQFPSFSAAVQINQSDILIFGGYDNSQAEKPQKTCYALTVSMDKHLVKVKNYNTNPLPTAEGFWNNNPIIHDRAVYALQNVTDQQDEQTALADQRKIIIFDGDRWR